jgi:hypothetical protein
MQSPMFVFAGFQEGEILDNLIDLLERLNKVFSEQQLLLSFTRKDKLLTSRFEDVSFYISIFNDAKEVKDWYQMAKDFELVAKPNPIDRIDFEKRLTDKKKHLPTLYNDTHYIIGKTIYAEIERLNLSKVYFFL